MPPTSHACGTAVETSEAVYWMHVVQGPIHFETAGANERPSAPPDVINWKFLKMRVFGNGLLRFTASESSCVVIFSPVGARQFVTIQVE